MPIGSLACSPFHVRFGKFSLLRPSEKKVEFSVNGIKQDFSMKLGDGGEAFFVFETSDDVPEGLQTSPLVSPASSPASSSVAELPSLQEPPDLDLDSISTSKSEPKDVGAGSVVSNRRSLSHDLGTDRSSALFGAGILM